ncbi:MAG: hypothetical protein F6K11_03310 [Leptolyngbya sp. SIO3F4]|nr:hypothetical protein [Leptolyngbya sp. SIO3F4]
MRSVVPNTLKKALFAVVTIAFLPACEQGSCSCWERVFEGEDIDYPTAVSHVEQAFIAKGFLQDGTPDAYLALIDSIITKNHYFLVGVDMHPKLLREHRNCFEMNPCPDAIYEKMKTLQNQWAGYKNISPELVFGDFKKMFDRNDLERTEVKHYFSTFYYIAFLQSSFDLSQRKDTPHAAEIHSKVAPQNILHVEITATNVIYVNEEIVELEDIKAVVIEYVSDTSRAKGAPEIEWLRIDGFGTRSVSRQLIYLRTDGGASYDLYIQVQNEITAGYLKVRNDIGQTEFGLTYETMLKNRDHYERELTIIRKLLPQRVSETEPEDL